MRAEIAASGRLRFDDGGEFVASVIHPGSVGKVDQGAGREAVTTRRCTPEEVHEEAKQLLQSAVKRNTFTPTASCNVHLVYSVIA